MDIFEEFYQKRTKRIYQVSIPVKDPKHKFIMTKDYLLWMTCLEFANVPEYKENWLWKLQYAMKQLLSWQPDTLFTLLYWSSAHLTTTPFCGVLFDVNYPDSLMTCHWYWWRIHLFIVILLNAISHYYAYYPCCPPFEPPGFGLYSRRSNPTSLTNIFLL